MGSSGLGTLVAAHKALRQADGELRVACTDARIRGMIHLTGLDRFIPLYASLTAALEGR